MKHPLIYAISRFVVRLFASAMLRFDMKHLEALPAGPKLFVANHPSATDPFLIHLVSQEEMNVMITEKAFQVPFFGWFLRRVREIPVPLEQGSTSLEQARQHLAQGRSVAIFIEGLISPDEKTFMPPRTGAARLALTAGVPVVPVGIYLRHSWRLNISSQIQGSQTEAYWYLHGPYAVTVGQALRFTGEVEDRAYVREITVHLMDSIKTLAAQSEARGRPVMPSSWLIKTARFLAPLFRRGKPANS